MSAGLIPRAAALWLLIAVLAAANGALREFFLVDWVGAQWAQPLSGGALCIIIFAMTWLCFPLLGRQLAAAYWRVGLVWLLLTLLLEVLLGRVLGGMSWGELLRTLDPRSGNLMTLALLVTACAPRLVARLKGVT